MSFYRIGNRGLLFSSDGAQVLSLGDLGTPVGGQTANMFFFLNSLYNHVVGTGTANTYVSNWLGRLSAQAPTPNTLTFSQRFGFAEEWPSVPQINGNTTVMEVPQGPISYTSTWVGANTIEVVGFVTDNFFGMSVAPDQPNTGGWNYITELLRIIDGWEANAPNPNRTYRLYSSWSALRNDAGNVVPAGALGEGVVNEPGKLAWYARNETVYEPWNALIVSMLQAARPTLDIRLHEVGKALRVVHRDIAAIHGMNMTDLFFDGSHGKPSWYLMAGIAEYICQFGEKPPAGLVFDPAWGVHATVEANYQVIVDNMWTTLNT